MDNVVHYSYDCVFTLHKWIKVFEYWIPFLFLFKDKINHYKRHFRFHMYIDDRQLFEYFIVDWSKILKRGFTFTREYHFTNKFEP